jgi:hypothetical protein
MTYFFFEKKISKKFQTAYFLKISRPNTKTKEILVIWKPLRQLT